MFYGRDTHRAELKLRYSKNAALHAIPATRSQRAVSLTQQKPQLAQVYGLKMRILSDTTESNRLQFR